MRFWLGRKSAPVRQPLLPAWLNGDGEAGLFATNYQAQLNEVYRTNPVGLRSVRLVAGLVGGLPLFGSDQAIELVRARGLLEQVAAALLLHGNAYVQLAADGQDRPAELHLLRPERVSVVCGAGGWPAAYLHRSGGQAVRIAREDALGRRQVAHMKALNPADDYNEALQRIDLLLSASVESAGLEAPPASPAPGDCYLVASAATGEWSGKSGMLAGYGDCGWRYVAPVEGLRLLDRSSGQMLLRRNGSWESGVVRAAEYQIGGLRVVRERQPSIADPSGGTVVDGECRAVIAAILAMLRAHGLIA